jgi:uncharacterized membrane protein
MMFRRLLLALAAAVLLTAPATAAIALFRSPDVKIDWGAHKSLAALKCEDPAIIADMTATLKDMM